MIVIDRAFTHRNEARIILLSRPWKGQNLVESIRKLTEKSRRATAEFLDTEVDLGFTFCESARIEAGIDPAAAQRLKEKVQDVIRTVEQFAPRLEDDAERLRISARTEMLRGELAELERPIAEMDQHRNDGP